MLWVDSVLPAPSWTRSSHVTWLRSRLLRTRTISRGLDHFFQYLEIVIMTLRPFICMAPSPMHAITVRSGKAIFPATAYGVPAPSEARPPEREAFMPLRSFRSRANQLATDPESAVT